jgi:hypothetical protein
VSGEIHFRIKKEEERKAIGSGWHAMENAVPGTYATYVSFSAANSLSCEKETTTKDDIISHFLRLFILTTTSKTRPTK